MQYWLCCDGGGTKLITLLIDETLNIINESTTGGINPNFMSLDNVRNNMNHAFKQVLNGKDISIEACYVSMPAPSYFVEEALAGNNVYTKVFHISEGQMGILAGIGEKYGFAALSGTGSDVFYVGHAFKKQLGGWGLLLGDEGSGAYIGQKALIAVIHDVDGRGEKTLLSDELASWLGFPGDIHENYDIFFSILCEKVYSAPSSRGVIASFTPHVTAAFQKGDSVAGEILKSAGSEMAKQTNALVGWVHTAEPSIRVNTSTICGSAWKSDRIMYNTYRDMVHDKYPDFAIQWPIFDAIAGGAVLIGLEQGYTKKEIISRMRETFSDYQYPKE